MSLSQKCGEKQLLSAFKVTLHLSSPKRFQYYEASCLGTQNDLYSDKKISHRPAKNLLIPPT